MDSRGQIASRMLEVTSDDTAMGLLFEGLFALLRETFNAQVVAGLERSALGEELLASFFRYPVAQLLKVSLTAMDLSPGVVVDASKFMRTFGARVARKTKDAPIARAVMQLGGGDPHRVLSSFAAGCKTILSFGERTPARLGERAARLSYERELLGPAFALGLIEKVFEIIPDKITFNVTSINSSGSAFAIELKW